MHCADTLFTNWIDWDRDIAICLKQVLEYPNVSLIMEQTKLQCHCSVEPKEASGTIKIKTKLGNLFHLNADC